ncbi:MAG: alkaline phosphatase family protein [Parvibaculum sp.]|nr:alkaline phosphatase family protein [Parvibaculum sp.]
MFQKAQCWLIAALACVAIDAGPASASTADRTVVVALFDGFAPAMVKSTDTPNLDRMQAEGAWSHRLAPVFPSVSLTNHVSFTTGCWPAGHGILSNIFFDPKRGRFDHSYDADWRTGCETMWEAAERQGVVAAALQIAGRGSGTRGKLATHANWPRPHMTDDQVVERAIELLSMKGADRPRLIALYFTGPDGTAHRTGTLSANTLTVVRRSDAIVGKLMKAIRALPREREATLIVGTDHGMMDVGPLINIARIMNKHEIKGRVAAAGASAYIYLNKNEDAARVERVLKGYGSAFDVYRRGSHPAFAKLGTGPRTGDLLLVAKAPHWIEGPEVFPDYAHMLGVTTVWPEIFTPPVSVQRAAHGYDPATVTQMHGIFYAWGSGVAKGKRLGRIDIVDVHPTVMALLGLKPGKGTQGKALALGR